MSSGLKLLAASLAFCLAIASARADTTTLQSVCGQDGKSPTGGVSQEDRLCKAAYGNGNAWVVNDNNSRVWAPVAVVCGYTCILSSA